MAAFAAIAKYQDVIGGKVKITAFENVPGHGQHLGPTPGTCNLMAFPAGRLVTALTAVAPGAVKLLTLPAAKHA